MITKIKYIVLSVLLWVVSSTSLQSQQITQVEYWFGNDFANATKSNVTYSNDIAQLDIPYPINDDVLVTGQFINYRFKDSNGRWSAIYTQPVVAQNEENIVHTMEVEYWFDNKFTERKLTTLSDMPPKDGNWNGQMTDISIPKGAKQIHYRFKSAYNTWSPIVSTNLLFNSSYTEYEKIEYWFDNDFANRQTTTVSKHVGSDPKFVNLYNNDIQWKKGSRTIHYRLVDKIGQMTPIYSYNVNEMDRYSNYNELEYWFDNDFAHRQTTTISKHVGSDPKYVNLYNNDIQWKKGSQTMHYRLIDNLLGRSTPIFQYSQGMSENRNNKIVKAEYWFNDRFEERSGYTVNNSNPFYIDKQNIKTNYLNDSIINIRYADVMDNWSCIYSYKINQLKEKKGLSPTGNLMLTENHNDKGVVMLKWNTVENTNLYRVYLNGRYIGSKQQSQHPAYIRMLTTVPVGNNSFQVTASNFVSPKKLNSNKVNFTIEEQEINNEVSIIEYGKIRGIITDQNGHPVSGVKIQFSDENITLKSERGLFTREGISYGTKGNMTLSKEGCTFTVLENKTLAYDINSPITTYKIKAEQIENPTNNDDKPKLIIVENIQILTENPEQGNPFSVKVKVRNVGGKPFSGIIKLTVSSSDKTEQYRPRTTIAETSVTIDVGYERVLEFYTNNLNTPSGECSLYLNSYANNLDLNSYFNIIQSADGDETQNNSIEVKEGLNSEELKEAWENLDNALKASKFMNNILYRNPDSKVLNELTNDVNRYISGVQSVKKKIDEINKVVQLFNNLETLSNTQNQIDYYLGLITIAESFIDENTPIGAFINGYIKPTKVAIKALKKINQRIFSTTVLDKILLNSHSDPTYLVLQIRKDRYFKVYNTYYSEQEINKKIKKVQILVRPKKSNREFTPYELKKVDVRKSVPKNRQIEGSYFFPAEIPSNTYFSDQEGFIEIEWENSKITLIPFTSNYVSKKTYESYVVKLDAINAGGNANMIPKYVRVNYK